MVANRRKAVLSAISATLAAASFTVGCLSPNSLTCSDGLVCPVGSRCNEVDHVCFTPTEVAACGGSADGDDCVLSQVLGTCRSGGCRLGESVWSATASIGSVAAIWAREPGDAYALADAVSHWDGTRWSSLAGGPVAGSGPDAGLVVGGGIAIRWDGSTWSSAMPGLSGSVGGFWANDPSDAFAVFLFSAALLHWDQNGWSTLWENKSYTDGPIIPRGVWATSTSDVFVVGDGLWHWDGANMTGAPSNFGPWNAVWGSGRNDVYAVGDGGLIAHWNGASWSAMTSGTTQSLLAVHGSSAKDVFAGGNDVLLRLHNGAWEPIDLAGFTTIRKLWVTPGRVFVGGEGEIHLDRPR